MIRKFFRIFPISASLLPQNSIRFPNPLRFGLGFPCPVQPRFRPDLQPDGNLAIEAVIGIRVQCCGIGCLPCQVLRDLILSSSRKPHDSASCHGSPLRLDPFELGKNVKRRSVGGKFELDRPVFRLGKTMSDPRLFELIFLNISPENIHWLKPLPCPGFTLEFEVKGFAPRIGRELAYGNHFVNRGRIRFQPDRIIPFGFELAIHGSLMESENCGWQSMIFHQPFRGNDVIF